ncbi:phosphodiesterase [Vibrio sp. E150_011]
MKLFFASDLHGSVEATQRVLEAYQKSGAANLVILGDVLNHGPRNPVPDSYHPPKVAELLNAHASDIIAVRGNCDSEVDQMLLDFPMMADYAWVILPSGQRLFLTHGHLYNAAKRPKLKKGDVIVHGHTHIPVADWDEEQVIFNPGSITFPRDGYAASFGWLEDETMSVKTFDGETICSIKL